MKILVITPAFPPEITGSGQLYFELSQSLVAKGHDVTVVTAIPRQRMGEQRLAERYRRRLLMREEIAGIKVIRVASLPLPLSIPLTKGLDHFSIAFSYLMAGLRSGDHDVILVYSPPLPLGLTAYALSKMKGIPFVLNVQDIFPQYAIDVGLLRNASLIRIFRACERFLYRVATVIAAHSERNRDYLVAHGVDGDKVVAIHNWADTEALRPGPKQNAFRQERELQDRFLISYAGTMGWAQGLDVVVEAAARLVEQPDIEFLLVGDGPCRAELQAQAARRGATNITFLPLQQRDRYQLLVNASDVCLISLNQHLSTPVVPGKLFDIMASGRAVVASVPLDGDAPAIVNAAQCGITVAPDQPQQLADAILRLRNDPGQTEVMGLNGRRYVEEHFSKAVCTEAYSRLLQATHEGQWTTAPARS